MILPNTIYVMTPPDLYEIQAILLPVTKISPEYIVPCKKQEVIFSSCGGAGSASGAESSDTDSGGRGAATSNGRKGMPRGRQTKLRTHCSGRSCNLNTASDRFP